MSAAYGKWTTTELERERAAIDTELRARQNRNHYIARPYLAEHGDNCPCWDCTKEDLRL